MKKSKLWTTVVALIVALCGLSICAAPSFALTAETHGSINNHGLLNIAGVGNNLQPPQVLQYYDHYDNASANTLDTITNTMNFMNGGIAISTSSGAVGELHVYSYAEFPAGSLATGNGYSSADARAAASDWITPFPFAAPTDINFMPFSMDISGLLSMPNFEPGGSYSASVTGYVTAWDGYGPSQSISFNSGTIADGIYTVLFPVIGTRTIGIGGALQVSAYVASNATIARDAFADYSAYFYISSSAPNINTIGVSGHDYAMPVSAPAPEPATVILMVFGLVGLAAFTRIREIRTRFSNCKVKKLG